MFRIIIVGLMGLGLPLAACSNAATPAPTTRDGHHHSQPANRKAPVPGVTALNFDRVQLAIDPNDYPSTVEQVRALLGKPTRITNQRLNGFTRPLTTYVWEHPDDSLRGAVVSVSFHDNEAVIKRYRAAHLSENPKVTSHALDHLAPNTTYLQVTRQLGTPNTVANTGSPSESVQTITYDRIKNRPHANVTLTFYRNQLVAKARTAI